MITEVLSADVGAHVRRAAEIVHGGGLVAFPTDTVYGLGATAFDPFAVLRIYAAKERPPGKAIPVLLAAESDLRLVCPNPGPIATALAARFWPGPLTLIVPKDPRVPDEVSLHTIGLRVPAHPVALELLRQTGPMAVTSANLAGGDSPITADDVSSQLDGRLALILDGGPTPGGTASTVVDCTTPTLTLVRAGPLSLEDLQAALG